jgi:ketosteroid isomerase-like protein
LFGCARKRSIVAPFAFGCVALMAACGSSTPSHERTPEQVVDRFHDALQARDATLALSLLSGDAVVCEMGKSDRSRRDYAALHLPNDMAIASRGGREQVSRETGGSGDTQWVVTSYRETVEQADKAPPATIAETAILRRIGDGWQIVHLHWSSDQPLRTVGG